MVILWGPERRSEAAVERPAMPAPIIIMFREGELVEDMVLRCVESWLRARFGDVVGRGMRRELGKLQNFGGEGGVMHDLTLYTLQACELRSSSICKRIITLGAQSPFRMW
jgi:hypothetical protein